LRIVTELVILAINDREDPMTEEIVYTIPEVCKLLKVSDDTIRRLIKSGELEAVKIGNQWRIKKASVDNLLKKK
jgi:excisionase family DNA binding protein